MADAPPTKRARMHDLATPTSQDTPCKIAGRQTPGRVDTTTSANAKERSLSSLEHLITPLTILFNNCLSEGNWPDMLKVSKVLPTFKKGVTSMPDNFRPIAIVPIVSKIFEILVKKQIVNYCEHKSIITPSQFGFRKGKSTINALLQLNVSFSTRRWHIKSKPTKLLGVILDSRLNWQPHIEQLCSRLSSQIFALRQLSPVLPKLALRDVYVGIIHNHICYGILLWVVRLSPTKCSYCKNERFECLMVYSKTCLAEKSLVSTHRNCNNLLRHSDIHNYNTRTAGNLMSTYSRLDIITKNKIDVNLYNMFVKKFEHNNCRNMSIARFRILVKNYLLEQCFYSEQNFIIICLRTCNL
nr:unnamed protein product [Callosobruchus analis]